MANVASIWAPFASDKYRQASPNLRSPAFVQVCSGFKWHRHSKLSFGPGIMARNAFRTPNSS
ncbi:hypothetical protein BVRB_020910 [Beta vulgaris subsp. vulgaris]|uniref:Uncharacterized protein n=1 Tax=Beta vulgaris subsp. vulgaris TaxID=3555 RepID=A0A0J8B3R0_BETVV|nr:hypothetical protein BVRB_020910 [Beta vulgaris subsp. vulgaris]